MIQGRNTEIEYRGRKVHVQTQFMPTTKTIVSLIFDNGAIIGSRKKRLIFEGEPEKIKDIIEEKLVEQHKRILDEIKAFAQKDKEKETDEDMIKDFLNEAFGVSDDD